MDFNWKDALGFAIGWAIIGVASVVWAAGAGGLTQQYKYNWNSKYVYLQSWTSQEDNQPVDETLTVPTAYQLQELRIQSDGAVTTSEEFQLTLDSGAGASWDQEIYGKDLSESNAVPHQYFFDGRRTYGPNDAINIDFPNTEGNEISWELIIRVPR